MAKKIMLSGIKALNDLDQSLNSARRDIHRLDRELETHSNKLASAHRQQAKVMQQIAAVRLDAIASNTLAERLSGADQSAANLLEQRQTEVQELNAEIDHLVEQLTAVENERKQLSDHCNSVAKKLAKEEAQTQQSLEHNAEYQAAFAHAQQADSIADEAQLKAEQSAADMGEKAKPYQDDELFMYLWQRRFGTSDYEASNFLTRHLDQWVAGLINFEPSRQNYWNLQEIPKRLQTHAETVREQSNEAIDALQAVENTAMQDAGVHQLQVNYEQARLALDAHDDKIKQAEQTHNNVLTKRAQFAATQDPLMQQALAVLSDAMQHQSMQTLQQGTFATASMRDDDLVNELHQYATRAQDTEEDLRGLRQTYDTQLKRLRELESVRRNFKQHRFDDMRSGFGNEKLLNSALSQFMQGLLSGAELWRVIQRNQRHQDVGAWPDFGSGQLGHGSVWTDVLGNPNMGGRMRIPRSRRTSRRTNQRTTQRRNSTWHWPNSNNGGFKLPGGRSSNGGGGFKTGGGF